MAYRIRPGAGEQDFHRDDSLADSRIMSLQISLVDTVAEQGAFQVEPGTHKVRDASLNKQFFGKGGSWAGTSVAVVAFDSMPSTSAPPLLSPGAAEQGLAHQLGGVVLCDHRVTIAVPAGSVMCYSPNVVHRGGANTSEKERLIIALTLVGAHGLIPHGIPLAIEAQDQGRWWLEGGKLGLDECVVKEATYTSF